MHGSFQQQHGPNYGVRAGAPQFLARAYPEHQVDLGDVTLNYVDVGSHDRPPLLLIPGQAESWWGYEEAIGLLEREFRVLAVDMRGQGRSTWTPGRYSFDILGSDLLRFVDAVELGPVVVSGNSSGGVLAAWLSAYAPPRRIRGAILEDPPLFSGELDPLYGPSQRQSSGPVLELWREFIGDQWSKGDWEGFLAAARRSRSPLARMMAAFADVPQAFREYDPEWSRAFLAGTMANSLRSENLLAAVRSPILLTHHSRIEDPQTGYLIGAMSDLQARMAGTIIAESGVPFAYRSFPDAMHAMHHADPALFAATVTEWASTL